MLLKIMVDRLGLNNHIEFLGWIPHDAVPDFMREIDIFVMPSVCRESFGIAALEASASFVPVIASNIGGIHEVVWHDETGFLVTPESAEDLAIALKSLIQSADLRSCMGAQGRDFVKNNFSWEKTVKKLHEVFQEVANR